MTHHCCVTVIAMLRNIYSVLGKYEAEFLPCRARFPMYPVEHQSGLSYQVFFIRHITYHRYTDISFQLSMLIVPEKDIM